jgi:hypothetical protein
MEKFSYHDFHKIDVTVFGDMAELIIRDIKWTRWFGESYKNIEAIDHDGGPYITNGYKFGKYTVDRIMSANEKGNDCSIIVKIM